MSNSSTYKFRRERGLCAGCGLVYTGSRCYCDDCSARKNEKRNAVRKLWKRSGKCTICGNKLDDKRFNRCSICRERERNRPSQKKKLIRKKSTPITTEKIISIVKSSAKKAGIEAKIITQLSARLQVDLDLLGFGEI